MKKIFSSALVYLAGLALIAIPVLASMFLAGRQSAHIEAGKARVMAGEVMRRSEETGEQGRAAAAVLMANHAAVACSPDEIALMRRLAISSSYLQGVGRVQNNRLICSSLGDHGAGFDLGPPDYITDRGAKMWVAATLPVAPRAHFLISDHHGFVAIVHRDLIFDVQDYANGISLAIVDARTHHVITTRGPFLPGWLRPLAPDAAMTHNTGDFIVALQRSAALDMITIAAIPKTMVDRLARELMVYLVPFGLLAGLALAAGFFWLLRSQGSLPAMLRSALRRDEFFLVYQPILRLDTGRCVGAEALLRWRRRDGTLIRPDVFIQAAEDNGLITSISRHLFGLIERDAPALVGAFPQLHISINLSARDLRSDDLLARLDTLMAGAGLTADNLIVEATERGLIDVGISRPIVQRIRAAGIGVAIDDFGTGYSSLSYLTTLPVNFLKIDKSFIDTIGTTAATNSVVLHIIAMAKSLNLAMIAEGVETEAQARFLRQHEVHFAQGFLYAKPMPPHDFVRYMQAEAEAHSVG